MTRYDYDTWFVYELIDPRSKAVFYIGKSATPRARLAHHKRSPESAAYERIKEIRASGLEVEQYIIGRFNTEYEAFDYEGYLIRKTPGLVNIMGYLHASEPFDRPVLNVEELQYISTENQPVPDEDNMVAAIAVHLPQLDPDAIRAVLRTKAVLFDADYEYAGVTDE